MKKLMTMLAAAAMAFGLYAEEPEPIVYGTPTTFEADGEFDGDGNLVTNETAWSCTDDAATLKQGAYNNDAYQYDSSNKRYSAFTDENTKFLNVKTAFDKPLVRAEDVAINGEVYFDQLVKFTAADEELAIDEDAKIALYVKEELDADENPTATNLYVVAGKYVGGELVPATNVFAFADLDAWHRVTIKTLKGYDSSELAFQIFIDKVALKMAAPAFDAAAATLLSDDAKVINSAKKLFASLKKNDVTVNDIAFAGTGAIDDVIATTEVPGEWAANKAVTLAWDEQVTSFTYTIDGESTPVTTEGADFVQIPYSEQFDVTLSDLTFSDNWDYAGFDLNGSHFDGAVITFTGEKQTATIKAKDVTPRVQVVIGNVTNTYPTIAAAIASIKGSDSAEIKLNEDMLLSNVMDFSLVTTGEVELDLAGKKITGVADAGELAVVMSAGALTIKDSVGGGEINPAEGEEKAVLCTAKLTITGGKFNGAVSATAGAISGGSFKSTDGAAFYLNGFLADGFEAKYAEGYWTVDAIPTYTLTIEPDANADYTLTVDGGAAFKPENDTISATNGAKVVLTATANTGYEYTEGDNIVNHTMTTDGGQTITVPAPTALVYNITIANGGEGASATPETYTYNVATEVELVAGTSNGYTFVSWTAPAGCTIDANNKLTIPAGTSGDITVTANWEATQYTITVTPDDASADPVSYSADDFEGGDVSVTLTAKEVAGKVFKKWTVTTPGAGFTIDDDTAMETTLNIQLGTFANFEIVANYDDEGGVPVDPADPPTTDEGRANLATLNEALGANAATWTAAVYGDDGKVPGSKLDDSTPELIAAAAKYNLKVMASPVTVTVGAATDGGFTFTLSDAGKDNPVVAATLAQELIKYTASLENGGSFAPSTAATVTATVSEGKVSAKFTGKDKTGEAPAAAGFMKVDLTVQD